MEADANGGGEGGHEKSRSLIQVSNTKKPVYFYVNLSKRYMKETGRAELSGLGLAMSTVVTIAEILKNAGFASIESIKTSTIEVQDPNNRPAQKAKLEIFLVKTENFDELMAEDERQRQEQRERKQQQVQDGQE